MSDETAAFGRYAVFVGPQYDGPIGWDALHGSYHSERAALASLPEYADDDDDAVFGQLVDLHAGKQLYYLKSGTPVRETAWVPVTTESEI